MWESCMTRPVFVLALMGSLAAAAQAEGVENLPATLAVKAGVPVAQLQAAGAQITSFCRPNVGIRRWLASSGRSGEQGSGHDRQGHCLVEALGQRPPEIRSGRRRHNGLTDRHEGRRFRGRLRQRRRTACGAVHRDLPIREIKTSSPKAGKRRRPVSRAGPRPSRAN